jgi:hypothetical protein
MASRSARPFVGLRGRAYELPDDSMRIMANGPASVPLCPTKRRIRFLFRLEEMCEGDLLFDRDSIDKEGRLSLTTNAFIFFVF